MKPDLGRPQLTPELYERFAAYLDKNPTWGSLHIVLDDGNLETHHVEFCVEWARKKGDAEGAALAEILLAMTVAQRGRISRRIVWRP